MPDLDSFEWAARTRLMGVLNVTPDSFSGDGVYRDPWRALEIAQRMVEEGADVIDVGGESTRPGHVAVTEQEELSRVLPVIRLLVKHVALPISIDTSKARVAQDALAAGAKLVNDVSGLSDPAMAGVVAAENAWVAIGHMQSDRGQLDLISWIRQGLKSRIKLALSGGVAPSHVLVDPGFGFTGNWRDNLELVRRLPELHDLDLPLLIGPSRKGTIARVLGDQEVARRDGTAALVALCAASRVAMVRVHDVAIMRRVVAMVDAVYRTQ